MNLKMKAKIFGLARLMNPLEWTTEIEQFKKIVEREDYVPLEIDRLSALMREMNEHGQRRMAQVLQFPFAQRNPKKWPELLFIKSIQSFLKHMNHDADNKRRIVLAVVQEVQPLLEGGDRSLDAFVEQRSALISRFGFWHFYWAFYFHPDREMLPERWSEYWQAISEMASGGEQPSIAAVHPSTTAMLDASPSENDNPDRRKTSHLEKRLVKERELRIALEYEITQNNKRLRQKEKEHELAVKRLAAQAEQLERARKEADEAGRQFQAAEQMWKQKESNWENERQNMRQQLRLQEQEIDSLNRQNERLANDHRRLRSSADEWQRNRRDPNLMSRMLKNALQEDIRRVSMELTHEEAGKSTREQMRRILDLLDALDRYRSGGIDHLASTEPVPVETASSPKEQATIAEQVKAVANDALTGTFYRRDHGGYIQLENGEVFNITESMVHNRNLQHEAEVLCRPSRQDSGATLYEIELLFQGDDAYSPIRQYEGYVQLGEHYTWYCIDLNNPERRYPLHRKDVEIQQPEDGMPCKFNLSEGSEYARLSRLYRDMSSISDQKELNRTLSSKIKGGTDAGTKPDPFLTGCTITIIGGQRKWFEDVVTESGAVLIHDTGDHPERINADLRRSQALFMLITATSHRATWEGVEIAKANGIPHFIIQGSKSNLRKLLWDNREMIKTGD
ncbi:hypothetical protein ACF3MZ_17455 [Paenibacillaceae bacterium WGS1546]|uniref:hypothetical protein n=1 Tax=Cohnella sp. WGS1546 TaxID=3366810 RepID=UPI00372D6624